MKSRPEPSLFASHEIFEGERPGPAATTTRPAPSAPLAERMRPRCADELVGQAHVLGADTFLGRMLRGGKPSSCILWGPPGSGKTTVARLLSTRDDFVFEQISAVLAGVKDVREVIARARLRYRSHGKGTILFVDEIHRFNKAQQDAFLPHVEAGTIVLIGATTENPSFEIIAPLLSRCRVVVLDGLDTDMLGELMMRALHDSERGLGAGKFTIDEQALAFLAERAEEGMQAKAPAYDKNGEQHYNVISAFIKSMRASDTDASLYWLARMLEAGEDPLFIARRMVVFASEDVGLAEPQALALAMAVKDAVCFVGLPEARINLAHGVAYLAAAPKSNASYVAFEAATAEVHASGAPAVPRTTVQGPGRRANPIPHRSR